MTIYKPGFSHASSRWQHGEWGNRNALGKAEIVLGSAAAGVVVIAMATLAIPLFLVAFVCNLPKAFENHEAANRHHKNRQ